MVKIDICTNKLQTDTCDSRVTTYMNNQFFIKHFNHWIIIFLKSYNNKISLWMQVNISKHFMCIMEKAMAPHSSTLAWKIPWTEEPGRLQSMGSLEVGRQSDFTFTFHFHALEKEMATHSSVLAWRIPGSGEPGGLLSVGSHRVRHDWSNLAAAAATNKQSKITKLKTKIL